MSIIKPIGDPKILDKKPPQSVSYKDVKSSIDTGMVKRKSDENDSKLFKKVENFKRIKSTELMKLILLKMNINKEDHEDQEKLISDSPKHSVYSSQAFSCISEAKTAVHQTDPILIRSRLREDVSDADNLVLVLDVRDPDDFAKCHLQTAYSYPAATVNRTVNPFTFEMLSFKNHPQKKIVVYDRDEKIACPVANLLFEKGFDNIVVLTGGLQEFFQKHPNLIVGEVPKDWIPAQPKKKRLQSASSVSSKSTQSKPAVSKKPPTTAINTPKVWK
ncbi:hypothetical protein C9374_002766 [Naegleria lovaniensis]|uniref:Rhodanese domain-containing protein n=1 Tax=Naegleria lovaniensis TaxID=51637 RepID=A0AA88KK35_NAELO|nr:uncharacterized protein C9374_002766 [Naegleria lovaniensis]KAG2386320.1 hypothetical protein C9374_002766 [Naegleria lovaniensis]